MTVAGLFAPRWRSQVPAGGSARFGRARFVLLTGVDPVAGASNAAPVVEHEPPAQRSRRRRTAGLACRSGNLAGAGDHRYVPPTTDPSVVVSTARRTAPAFGRAVDLGADSSARSAPPSARGDDCLRFRKQKFSNWELCLVDDGSKNPDVTAMLELHATSDHRIHLKRRQTAGGISAATNAALALANGEYIALLDHDDTLTPDALERVAAEVAAHPDLDMIYSDEDVVGDDGKVEHHPKPGWSPEHMSALMYTCHLGVYRRALAIDLGGFRSEFDGC